MAPTEAKISLEDGKIIVKLPITQPTSRFRVKKKTQNGFGIPVSTRKEPFPTSNKLEEYYIEWQIKYKKDKDNEYNYELSQMVKLAFNNGILMEDDIRDILKFAESVKSYLEDIEIKREKTRQNLYGFNIYRDTYPIAKKELSSGEFIEIALKHKQYAVGYQSMVYVCIPLSKVKPSLANRTAKPNETVEYEITPELIKELLKAFTIASETHKQDIVTFLNRLLKRYDRPN
jgi:hypothetical protein